MTAEARGVGAALQDLYDAVAGWSDGVSAPEATLLAAAGVLLVGASTIGQKVRNDKRDQWWKRAQWAIDLTLAEDERSQVAGLAAVELLAQRRTATRRDRQLLLIVVDEVLDSYFDDFEAHQDSGDSTRERVEDDSSAGLEGDEREEGQDQAGG